MDRVFKAIMAFVAGGAFAQSVDVQQVGPWWLYYRVDDFDEVATFHRAEYTSSRTGRKTKLTLQCTPAYEISKGTLEGPFTVSLAVQERPFPL